MAFKKYNDDFSVERIEHGRRDELRVMWWTYKIISKLTEEKVKEFCIKILVPINLEEDKSNPFAHKIVKFKNTTNYNNPEIGDMYFFQVKKETTD